MGCPSVEGIGCRLGDGHIRCILRVCSVVNVNWVGVVENGMLAKKVSGVEGGYGGI